MNEPIARLAHHFQRFGERECVPASPLYARLSAGIARDEELLRLALNAQAGPVPNLFFGAVQYLLLQGGDHPLAAFYPSLRDAPRNAEHHDAFAAFRAFCLEHADAIANLLRTRRVQTNEVRRCACLLPAFTLVARRGGGRPLALVEIGASAGLNLLWDRYAYMYGEQGCGDPRSPVQLRCTLRGAERPPLPSVMPDIASRVGLDLNPIDVHDPDAVLWLQALIWPEQRDRAEHLRHAVRLAQAEPPTLVAGDAVALLPGVLAQIPEGTTVCLYHTFVLNQFPAAAREGLQQVLTAYAASRDIAVVGIEWQEPAPPVALTTYADGEASTQTLARCDAHGGWMEWYSA